MPCVTSCGRRKIKPKIVCLCGSTRFLDAFDAVSLRETLAGHIVLSVGSHRRSDAEWLAQLDAGQQAQALAQLRELHFQKIALADEILVVNVGGYIGESSRQEIDYAQSVGRRVRYLEPPSR